MLVLPVRGRSARTLTVGEGAYFTHRITGDPVTAMQDALDDAAAEGPTAAAPMTVEIAGSTFLSESVQLVKEHSYCTVRGQDRGSSRLLVDPTAPATGVFQYIPSVAGDELIGFTLENMTLIDYGGYTNDLQGSAVRAAVCMGNPSAGAVTRRFYRQLSMRDLTLIGNTGALFVAGQDYDSTDEPGDIIIENVLMRSNLTPFRHAGLMRLVMHNCIFQARDALWDELVGLITEPSYREMACVSASLSGAGTATAISVDAFMDFVNCQFQTEVINQSTLGNPAGQRRINCINLESAGPKDLIPTVFSNCQFRGSYDIGTNPGNTGYAAIYCGNGFTIPDGNLWFRGGSIEHHHRNASIPTAGNGWSGFEVGTSGGVQVVNVDGMAIRCRDDGGGSLPINSLHTTNANATINHRIQSPHAVNAAAGTIQQLAWVA